MGTIRDLGHHAVSVSQMSTEELKLRQSESLKWTAATGEWRKEVTASLCLCFVHVGDISNIDHHTQHSSSALLTATPEVTWRVIVDSTESKPLNQLARRFAQLIHTLNLVTIHSRCVSGQMDEV